MIIDFHTHIFPEKIAAKTIEHLENFGHIKAHTNGTLNGLKQSMKEAGITTSVILPVVTKPEQFDTINRYATSITGKDGIISFGGIHPNSENYKKELDVIIALGLKGIKLHPDYQDTFIDDQRYIDIITYAVDHNLIVSIHAGIDIGIHEPVHCPPDRAFLMLQKVLTKTSNPYPKIILAHTGGYDQWDQVEQYLVGQNVYFDISFSLPMISDDQMLRIIHNHGSERILFATDSPWGGQKETVQHVEQLPLTDKEKDAILYQNASKLLEL